MGDYSLILVYGPPGTGKTTIIENFINNVYYDHIYIISGNDDNNYNKYTTNVKSNYDINDINNFVSKGGDKLIILDDILHINLNSGKIRTNIMSIISQLRHSHTSVIIGSQMLYCIGKSFRLMAKYFITAVLDKDALDTLYYRTAIRRKPFLLNKYQFVLSIQGSNKIYKIKVKKSRNKRYLKNYI